VSTVNPIRAPPVGVLDSIPTYYVVELDIVATVIMEVIALSRERSLELVTKPNKYDEYNCPTQRSILLAPTVLCVCIDYGFSVCFAVSAKTMEGIIHIEYILRLSHKWP
jgi:hypothetical protein